MISQKCADIIIQHLKEFINNKGNVVLAVCGGRSVAPIFEILAKSSSIDWGKVHIFMVDERLVKIDSSDSNFKIFKENFLDNRTSVKPKPVLHPFLYYPEVKDKGTEEYEREIAALGGNYDIALFSSGEDGHVGALYPNHHSIHDDSEYYILMDDSPKPPSKRMSSSKKLLARTKVAILLVLGEAKRGVLEKITDKALSVTQCPAKLVMDLPTSYLLTDLK